jgi:long-subunit fatty acid transport protein
VGISGTPTEIGPLPDMYAACGTGGTRAALKTCVDVVVPMTATAGARYVLRDGKGEERGDLELDVRWENHKAATEIVVTVDAQVDNTQRPLEKTVMRHGFQDVISTRLGGSYGFPLGFGKLILRAGAAYDTAAAPESWTRLDIDSSDRLQFAGGAALEGKSWRVDLGGATIFSQDRTATGPDPFVEPSPQPPQDGRTNPDAQNPQSGPSNQARHPINLGKYTSGYVIVATGVTFWF